MTAGWALVGRGDGLRKVAEKRLGPGVVALRIDGLGASGEHALLVRPDGHLAWRGAPTDVGGLERWLDSALRLGQAP